NGWGGWTLRAPTQLQIVWLPEYTSTPRATYVRVPLWVLLATVALATAILWYRDRRPPKGHCRGCGYNLRGNVSGVCPECGVAA
ncbi:MAG: hypothetical protein ACYSVY_21515, partial [Planctomycetota bacterium]